VESSPEQRIPEHFPKASLYNPHVTAWGGFVVYHHKLTSPAANHQNKYFTKLLEAVILNSLYFFQDLIT